MTVPVSGIQIVGSVKIKVGAVENPPRPPPKKKKSYTGNGREKKIHANTGGPRSKNDSVSKCSKYKDLYGRKRLFL